MRELILDPELGVHLRVPLPSFEIVLVEIASCESPDRREIDRATALGSIEHPHAVAKDAQRGWDPVALQVAVEHRTSAEVFLDIQEPLLSQRDERRREGRACVREEWRDPRLAEIEASRDALDRVLLFVVLELVRFGVLDAQIALFLRERRTRESESGVENESRRARDHSGVGPRSGSSMSFIPSSMGSGSGST